MRGVVCFYNKFMFDGPAIDEIKTIENTGRFFDDLWQEIKDWWRFIKTDRIGLILFSLAVASFVYGVWQQLANHQLYADAVAVPNKVIMIDVGGAVVKPGVYYLKQGQRVQDAVAAAGGFDKRADVYWIDSSLNRARFLVDGEKIYIPFMARRGRVGQEKISLNYASLAQLDSLPGVGKRTAEKIIKNRPYSKMEELLEKRIISRKVWRSIKRRISL